jgi:hypothetical protein
MTKAKKIQFIYDFIQENPDARVSELAEAIAEVEAIACRSKNLAYAGRKRGRRCGIRNLTEDQKVWIRSEVVKGIRPKSIANKLGVGPNAIYRACRVDGGNIKTLLHPADKKVDELPSSPPKARQSRPLPIYSNSPSPYKIASDYHQQAS